MEEYSVVIPAHNEADRIVSAISSVKRQSVSAKKIVVVDDGSDDLTAEIAAGLDGVKVIRSEKASGPSHARNLGIEAAESPWVAFLDADDTWTSGKIEAQLRLADSTGAGLVYCGVTVCSGTGAEKISVRPTICSSQRAMRRTLLLWNCITGSSSAVIVERQLLERVGGFDTDLHYGEDWDLWLRLSQLTTFAAVDEALVCLNVRQGSQGGDPQSIFMGGRALIRKNADLFGTFWDGNVLRLRAAGRLYERRASGYLGKGHNARATADFLRAFMFWPFRQQSIVPLLKAIMGVIPQGRKG